MREWARRHFRTITTDSVRECRAPPTASAGLYYILFRSIGTSTQESVKSRSKSKIEKAAGMRFFGALDRARPGTLQYGPDEYIQVSLRRVATNKRQDSWRFNLIHDSILWGFSNRNLFLVHKCYTIDDLHRGSDDLIPALDLKAEFEIMQQSMCQSKISHWILKAIYHMSIEPWLRTHFDHNY